MATKKQALIIGLGQFGTALARTLAKRGVEVIAVDSKYELVQAIADDVDEALCFDATDEQALAGVAPAQRDLCVSAIGPEARDASIIVTALLRQLGAPRVIARASDALLERLLPLVGAHEVINPDREFGERVANRLAYEHIVEELPLGDDLVVTEIRPPPLFVGRELQALALPRRQGVIVIAIRRIIDGRGRAFIPGASEVIRGDDILVVVARPADVRRLLEAT